MMNVASTSNPSLTVNLGEEYPCTSNVSALSFVTMKLSGKDTYSMWETQILCLLKSQHMVGMIDGQFLSPAQSRWNERDIDAWIAADSLVKGWILSTLSNEVGNTVVNHLKQKDTDYTAKDLWDELQCKYGPRVCREAEEIEQKTKKEKIDEIWNKEDSRRRVYRSALKGQTNSVIRQLQEEGLTPSDILMSNGNTALHVAVSSSTKNHELLKKLLEMISKEITLRDLTNPKGSTLLHVAAIGGNTKVVDMLVERNPELLLAKDKDNNTPLALSISNMHTKTSHCLFEHLKEKGYGDYFSGKIGEELAVLAISCQDFSLAEMIIDESNAILYDSESNAILSDSDAVPTTLAQNFPCELNFWERRGDVVDVEDFMKEVEDITQLHSYRLERFAEYFNGAFWSELLAKLLFYFIFGFYAIVTFFGFFLKAIVQLFINDTSQVYEEAESLLYDVCYMINKDNSSNYHHYYNNSIFEATRRNSSTFIRVIIEWFPDAIWSTNKEGHNFIQYSVINRSEKIYNLLYEMSEHKNIYKTIKDSSGNTLLHLAARIAPASKLNLISGAALQIQRELQWFTEVERFVCPLNRIQKNLAGETPKMVFTKQHEKLLIQGEDWIKKTAESYTITAALIITIVFAAAITVPGGNNQESGIPIFTDNIAFTLFAISDAISLFTAVTSLLIFLSILTARFAEQDFLLKLPTKLIIGLTMLFLSTTAMIIAFGATLFLVFGQGNSSMLIPIGALTCLPITSFVTLQFPLIWELIRATYCGGFFVREKYDYFY